MKTLSSIDPCEFIEAVQPLLEQQDMKGLLLLLKTRWTPEQIRGLLSSHHDDARKTALLALALVGSPCCLPELAGQLRDLDRVVNEMAEHALWSIWFRMGTPSANNELARGAQALGMRHFEEAITHFNRALDLCPDFAEAYNQRAIAHYLQEHYEQAIADCRKTIELMPFHFGALAGMGNCFAHRGQVQEAITCYERALRANPHLSCIRQTLEELKHRQRAAG